MKCKKKLKVQNELKKELALNPLMKVDMHHSEDNNILNCKFCQRTFASDRLIIHQRICKNVKKNRK